MLAMIPDMPAWMGDDSVLIYDVVNDMQLTEWAFNGGEQYKVWIIHSGPDNVSYSDVAFPIEPQESPKPQFKSAFTSPQSWNIDVPLPRKGPIPLLQFGNKVTGITSFSTFVIDNPSMADDFEVRNWTFSLDASILGYALFDDPDTDNREFLSLNADETFNKPYMFSILGVDVEGELRVEVDAVPAFDDDLNFDGVTFSAIVNPDFELDLPEVRLKSIVIDPSTGLSIGLGGKFMGRVGPSEGHDTFLDMAFRADDNGLSLDKALFQPQLSVTPELFAELSVGYGLATAGARIRTPITQTFEATWKDDELQDASSAKGNATIETSVYYSTLWKFGPRGGKDLFEWEIGTWDLLDPTMPPSRPSDPEQTTTDFDTAFRNARVVSNSDGSFTYSIDFEHPLDMVNNVDAELLLVEIDETGQPVTEGRRYSREDGFSLISGESYRGTYSLTLASSEVPMANLIWRVRLRDANRDEFFSVPYIQLASVASVVEVIDRSDSMAEEIDQVKNAAKQFVDMMRVGGSIGVVSYNDTANTDYPLTPIDEARKKQDAKNAINDIPAPSGLTSIGAGILAADTELDQAGVQVPRVIVVMTDGHNTASPGPLDMIVMDEVNDGIVIHTVGFGPGRDDDVLAEVARKWNGIYIDAPTSADLRRSYQKLVTELKGEDIILDLSGTIMQGKPQMATVYADSAVASLTFANSWDGSDLDLTLIDPDGKEINHDNYKDYPNGTVTFIEEEAYEIYSIDSPSAGEWTLISTGVSGIPADGEVFNLVATSASSLSLSIATDKSRYSTGDRMQIEARLFDGLPVIDASVSATVVLPEGRTTSIELFDDGQHLDGRADDGVYANDLFLASPGSYSITVDTSGSSNASSAFTRTDFVSVVAEGEVIGMTVDGFAPTSHGFIIEFSEPIDASVLNLYDAQNMPFGPSDVVLVGDSVGRVDGSVVVEGNKLTFVATGGVLEPDNYTLLLRSAADGFKSLATGALLDGEWPGADPGFPSGDGVEGGDFLYQFTVGVSDAVIVSLPDFARGPGQAIDVQSHDDTYPSPGLPIRLSDATGVESVDLTLKYDPDLLTITGADLGQDAPVGSVVLANTTVPGEAVLSFFSLMPMSAGPAEIVRLNAVVPASAPYGAAHQLDLQSIQINEGVLAATDDDAVHVTALLGDATGDGTYSGLDAQRISRVRVGLDSGFSAYPTIDPLIIGDVTRNGDVSAYDSHQIAQEAIGLDSPYIPALPVIANLAPIAFDDSAATDEATPVDILLRGDDGNPEVTQTLTFTITQQPDHGTLELLNDNTGEARYTPDPDYNGSDSIMFRVTDDDQAGAPVNLQSDEATVTITIDQVNGQPMAASQMVSVLEEGSVDITLTGDDGDPLPTENQSLLFSIVDRPAHGTLSELDITTGSVLYQPFPNYFGPDSFTFRVTDDNTAGPPPGRMSDPSPVDITVDAVNDEPNFSASDPSPVNEDAGPQSITGWATFDPGAANESSQSVQDYIVSMVSNPDLFASGPSVAPDGTLTYEPAPDANGTSTFKVDVQDDGGTANGGDDTSPTQTFTITVNAVNDAPSFTATDPPEVNEDAGPQTIPGWATFDPGAANESSQSMKGYTFGMVSDCFASGPSVAPDGTLTYEPAPDANCTSTFKVAVQDDGGTANGGDDTSPTQTFTIIVNAVNDAPSFTATDPPEVNEDAGPQTISDWAAFDPGAANESSQSVQDYIVSMVSNPDLFASGPSVAPDGTLTYEPAPDADGTSTFKVAVQDDGGTANGGDDTSPTQTFTITVNSVNDAPSFTATDPSEVNEDAGPQSIPGWATFDPGATNESAQSVQDYIVSMVSNPDLFASGPSVAPDGTLTYEPAPDANGEATFKVAVQDDGGTANGGDDTSPTQMFTITVNATNDMPIVVPPFLPIVTREDVEVLIPIHAGDGDPEVNQELEFVVDVPPVHGRLIEVPIILVCMGIDVCPFPDRLGYEPDPDYHGPDGFTLHVVDDGLAGPPSGLASVPTTVSIIVTPVNDAPSFTATDPPEVNEDAGPQTISDWAAFDPGAANESSQSVQDYIVSMVSNPDLFASGPSVAPDGTLTYEPAPDANGTSTFKVAVQDDGGTANGGDDTSPTRTFTITVNPVNDAPSFTATNPPEVNEDAGPQTVSGWATFDPGAANESSQSVQDYIVSMVSNPDLFASEPSVATDGTLTYKPAPNTAGSSTFRVSVWDDGDTDNGGDDTSPTQMFTIRVNAVVQAIASARHDRPSIIESASVKTGALHAATKVPEKVVELDESTFVAALASDVAVGIPVNLTASPGKSIAVPVEIDNADGVVAADVQLDYDTSLLDAAPDSVSHGSVWPDSDTVLTSNVDDENGSIRVNVFNFLTEASGTGSLVEIEFMVKSSADVEEVTDLVLDRVELNESNVMALQSGQLTVIESTDEDNLTISGLVLADNQDSRFQPDKLPLPGVTLMLEMADDPGVVIDTTMTDDSGAYNFTQLGAGSYRVIEMQPAAIFPGGPDEQLVDLSSGEPVHSVNFDEGWLRGNYISKALFVASNPRLFEPDRGWSYRLREQMARAEEDAGNPEKARIIRESLFSDLSLPARATANTIQGDLLAGGLGDSTQDNKQELERDVDVAIELIRDWL